MIIVLECLIIWLVKRYILKEILIEVKMIIFFCIYCEYRLISILWCLCVYKFLYCIFIYDNVILVVYLMNVK